MTTKEEKIKTIFISWSKDYSKRIALKLKQIIEEDIFVSKNVKCFVSDVDISSGTEWYKAIKDKLKSSYCGILCLTKENVSEPWIYFESGAMIAHNIPVIPLLFDCKLYDNSPLKSINNVKYGKEKFVKMILDINKDSRIAEFKIDALIQLAENAFNKFNESIKEELDKLNDQRVFSAKYVYPSNCNTINKNTIYVSTPMASFTANQYEEFKKDFL